MLVRFRNSRRRGCRTLLASKGEEVSTTSDITCLTGNLDLARSEVFGWYTMKDSFVHDGASPFKNGRQGEGAWIDEA